MIISGPLNFNGGMSLTPPPVVPYPPIMGNVSYSINNTGNANTFANVTFTPGCNGGAGIIRYTVTSNTGISVSSACATTITVNGLTKGQPYTFVANALNQVGTSINSNVSAVIVPVTVPSAPVMANVSLVSANASVSFSTPTDNGGIAISNYTVTSSPCCITASSASSPIIVTGLTQCSSYTFTVKAVNSVGSGLTSNTSSSLSIVTPNQLWSWGYSYNNYGQLGLGNNTSYSSPKQIGSQTIWKNISSDNFSGFAIKTDGTLWSWGYNAGGQLGDGTTTNKSSPVQIGALTTWKQLANSSSCSTFAIKTDGTMWAWGKNRFGQTGIAGISSCCSAVVTSPMQIGSNNNWKAISRGFYNGHAITTCGKLYSWGYGCDGTLGLGNTTSYSSPKQVGALTNWSSLNSSGDFAIKTNGTLWVLGGFTGSMGLNTQTRYSSPKQVGALTTWKSVATNENISGAITTCGKLFTWGYNTRGGLGLNNNTCYSSPKQVGALTNWSQYFPGGCSFSLAIKTDGTLWSWGLNTHGTLGVCDTTPRSSPTQVGALTTWTKVVAGNCTSFALRTS